MSNFPEHNPYKAVTAYLYPQGLKAEAPDSIQRDKEGVRNLRQDYAGSEPCTSYDQNCARSYMLAYYPYNIETVYHILQQIPEQIPKPKDGKTLKVAFLGGGPMPELLGLSYALRAYRPEVKCLDAVVFDKNNEEWSQYRAGCTIPSAANYGGQTIELKEEVCDFLGCAKCSTECCQEILATADIVVMQNCITDIINSRDREGCAADFAFANIFGKLKPGAIFVICDLHYPNTKQALEECINIVEGMELGGKVLLEETGDGLRYESNIVYPEELNVIFDGTNGLMRRRTTKSEYVVFKRTDWVSKLIEKMSGCMVDEIEQLQYCNRYHVIGRNSLERVDVYYKSSGIISKVRTLDPGMVINNFEDVQIELVGKSINQTIMKKELAAIEPVITARAIEQEAIISQVLDFPYMLRYVVHDKRHNVGVVDQYFNGFGEKTKLIGQRGMSTSEQSVDFALNIVRGPEGVF